MNYHNLTSRDYRNHENFLLNPKIPWRKYFSSFLINYNPWHAFLAGQHMQKKPGTPQHCVWLLYLPTFGNLNLFKDYEYFVLGYYKTSPPYNMAIRLLLFSDWDCCHTLFKVLHGEPHKYILLTAGSGTFIFHPNIKPT